MKKIIAPKCNYCHGFGLAADLWGAGYRWPLNKEQAATTLARVDCDRCGCGGTANGEKEAERARGRMAAAQSARR